MPAFVTYDGDIEISEYCPLGLVEQLRREAQVSVAYFLAPLQDGKVASCMLPIQDFPMLYREIGEIFKKQSMPSTEIVDMRWLNLKAVCPSCGCTLTGRNLGTLYMMSQDGWDNIIIQGDKGLAQRWVSGLCVNISCTSHEVLLLWFPVHSLLTKKKDRETALALLESGHEWFYRKKAAEALATFSPETFGDPKIIHTLALLADKDPCNDVRQAAESTLIRIRDSHGSADKRLHLGTPSECIIECFAETAWARGDAKNKDEFPYSLQDMLDQYAGRLCATVGVHYSLLEYYYAVLPDSNNVIKTKVLFRFIAPPEIHEDLKRLVQGTWEMLMSEESIRRADKMGENE